MMQRAAFVSFLLHFCILSLFTFTFTKQTESDQPTFLFLGTILQKQDFEQTTLNPQTNPLLSSETVPLAQRARSALEASGSIDKPSAAVQHPKRVIKTQFKETPEVPQIENQPTNTVDENAAPYVPLRSIFR